MDLPRKGRGLARSWRRYLRRLNLPGERVGIYGKRIPVEVPIQLCLKDFLRSGDCGFDVGANIGALSVAMSRMAGKHGQVHAFEPNPKTLEKLRQNLRINQTRNVHVVPKAAWRQTGKNLSFYCDPSGRGAASSLKQWQGHVGQVDVKTETLDEYANECKVVPDVVKIDVEGSEFEVLRGARNLLTRRKPVLVLEYFPKPASADDALDFLADLGYGFYDARLYHRVDRQFYVDNNMRALVDVVAIPETEIPRSPYSDVEFIDRQDIDVGIGQLRTIPIILASPGRYVVVFDLNGPPSAVAGIRTVTSDGELLGYHEAKFFHLKTHSCSHMIFETDRACSINCELLVWEGESSEFHFRKVGVSRIVLNSQS